MDTCSVSFQKRIAGSRRERRGARAKQYRSRMKTRRPAIVALVLWLLFVASNEFPMFKSPHPLKPKPQITRDAWKKDHAVDNPC